MVYSSSPAVRRAARWVPLLLFVWGWGWVRFFRTISDITRFPMIWVRFALLYFSLLYFSLLFPALLFLHLLRHAFLRTAYFWGVLVCIPGTESFSLLCFAVPTLLCFFALLMCLHTRERWVTSFGLPTARQPSLRSWQVGVWGSATQPSLFQYPC